MDIDKCRQQIDQIDVQLQKLLNNRAEQALIIGEFKKTNHLKVFDPVREQKVYQNLSSHNQGPLSDKAIAAIFKAIILEHRNIEEHLEEKQT